MKLISIFLFIINLTFVYPNLLRNMAMRNKVQSLACNIFYNYKEIKKLDESILEIAKENNKHNNVFIPPEKYKELLNQIKKYKEIAIEFLVFKMMHGDKLAAKIFIDIKNENKQNSQEIDEEAVLERVRKIVTLTDGIGAGNHAKYLAHEYLQKYDRKRHNRCRIDFNQAGFSFLERRSRRSLMKAKTKSWQQIKFYKIPLNGNIKDFTRWKKEKENFPMVVVYGETYPTHCIYKNPDAYELVNNINEIELHPDCRLQIIGRQTDNTVDLKEIPIVIDNQKHNVKFWVSEEKLEYNCIGWAVGLQDFLEIHIYTEPQQDVKDLRLFKIYLKQYREALKTVEKKLKENGNDSDLLNRIINKKKPAPSLIFSFLNDEDILQKNLVGLNDNVSTLQIFEICNKDIDGAVIFYGQNGEMTHGARYVIELKSWTSKLGSSHLITHDLHLLDDSAHEKSLYGKPKFLFCSKSVNRQADGIDHGRIDFS